MIAIRSLLGTTGVVVGLVLLVLWVVLSPLLLLLAPFGVVLVAAWKVWRLRRRVGRGVKREHRRPRRLGKGVGAPGPCPPRPQPSTQRQPIFRQGAAPDPEAFVGGECVRQAGPRGPAGSPGSDGRHRTPDPCADRPPLLRIAPAGNRSMSVEGLPELEPGIPRV